MNFIFENWLEEDERDLNGSKKLDSSFESDSAFELVNKSTETNKEIICRTESNIIEIENKVVELTESLKVQLLNNDKNKLVIRYLNFENYGLKIIGGLSLIFNFYFIYKKNK